ncbi:ABC transporter permease [Schnuerera sp. xch1]|uniref:ABC transporter permease n=1 Tax=Schnuerera sp. xch1 TaxID=2874283 RepID=UPI001CC19C55|nr:ABC transporter permease [Schnuerera sp. xch1]MBZ2174953.1 ABC transporter permease [Schnuerera sp. xch1]
MSSIDLIRMGLKNLWRRKLRTFLTVLGVIIGTSSIVVMLSLGFGMQESFQNLLSRMGDLTTINVHKPYIGGYGGMSTSTSPSMNNDAKLDDTAITDFQNIPHVVTATPIVETWGVIKTGRYVSNTSIRGIDPISMKYFEYNISEGRLLKPGDDLVVIFGGSIKNSFYNPQSSGRGIYEKPDIDLMNDRMIFTFNTDVGRETFPGENIETPDYEDYKIKAVGVLEEGNPETDYTVYAPIDTVQRMIDEKERAENSNNRNQNRRNEY